MNTVYFSGKLKKKYGAVDIQNTICAFAKEREIVAQCIDEIKTVVDFGIWADYCYQKEPVQIKLRELTTEESGIQEHLDLSCCTDSCQILLGIIELFIWDKGPFKDEVLGDWSTMIRKIRDERRRVVPLWLYGIVDAWIYRQYSSLLGWLHRKAGERYYRIFRV